MSPINHSWTNQVSVRIGEGFSRSLGLLVGVENGGHIWRGDLALIDATIINLQKAKEIHLSRLASEQLGEAA